MNCFGPLGGACAEFFGEGLLTERVPAPGWELDERVLTGGVNNFAHRKDLGVMEQSSRWTVLALPPLGRVSEPFLVQQLIAG
jgi:hypothetical protein